MHVVPVGRTLRLKHCITGMALSDGSGQGFVHLIAGTHVSLFTWDTVDGVIHCAHRSRLTKAEVGLARLVHQAGFYNSAIRKRVVCAGIVGEMGSHT